MRTLTFASSFLLAFLVACGGASSPQELVDQGSSALAASDYDTALTHLSQAVEGLEPGDPLYVKANMKLVEARIHLDAERAKTEFLAFAAAHPDQVKEADYRHIGGKMTSSKKYVQAVEVIAAGVEKYGEKEKLVGMLQAIQKAAEQSGDSAATSALDGLGYL